MKNKQKALWFVLFLSLIGYFIVVAVAVNKRQEVLRNLDQETEEMMEIMRESARERLRWRAKLKAERKAYDDAVAADREKWKAQDKEFEDARKAYRDARAADRERDRNNERR